MLLNICINRSASFSIDPECVKNQRNSNINKYLFLAYTCSMAGFQIRTFFLPNLAPFSGDFFAQLWVPRDGLKARDGHQVST